MFQSRFQDSLHFQKKLAKTQTLVMHVSIPFPGFAAFPAQTTMNGQHFEVSIPFPGFAAFPGRKACEERSVPEVSIPFPGFAAFPVVELKPDPECRNCVSIPFPGFAAFPATGLDPLDIIIPIRFNPVSRIRCISR